MQIDVQTLMHKDIDAIKTKQCSRLKSSFMSSFTKIQVLGV